MHLSLKSELFFPEMNITDTLVAVLINDKLKIGK